MIQPVNQKARILVVDDSAFMRSAIRGMINNDPALHVIDTARDGAEAVEKVAQLKPDLVTMDMEMPRMTGLEALKVIMERTPVPVLMVSSLTMDGAQVTMDALDAGAVDFVCKDLGTGSLGILDIEVNLVKKIKEIIARKLVFKPAKSAIGSAPVAVAAPPVVVERKSYDRTQNVAVVALGTSCGGPKSLQEVLPFLPKSLPAAVLVVQHMPALFTKAFADRMNGISQLRVKEAEEGDIIEPGTIFIAKGGIHMMAHRSKALETRIKLSMHPENAPFRPSVDVMMHSVAQAYTSRVLGVIMTGMGNDGTEGLKAIKAAGGKSIVQNEATCIVYGMPKSAIDAGLADKVVGLPFLAQEIVNMI